MFHSIPKWPAFIWNIFSVISINLRYNKWQVIFSMFLMASCIYNFYRTPDIICALEGSCDDSLSTIIRGLFMRVVATTCFISRIIIILKGKSKLVLYNVNIEKFHAFSPMTRSETELLSKLSCRIVLGVLLLTVPFNALRLMMLLNRSDYMLLNFSFMYLQNTSMYYIETHFIVLCFNLYQKFVGINKDLTELKIDTILRNKYPFVSQTGEKYGKNNSSREAINSLATGHPMTNYVEQLKIKHRLVREAVKNLNDLFGNHLGLSLCSLCMYTMFDLYYYMMGIMRPRNYFILVCGWLLQYTFRFGSITILAHLTTKQVIGYDRYSNNRY